MLVLARALAVAGLLGSAGCAVFRLAVAPAALRGMTPEAAARAERAILTLARAAAALGVAGLIGWTLCVTAALAAPDSAAAWRGGAAAVLGDTTFGHLVLAQAALLLAVILLLGRGGVPRWTIAAGAGLTAAVLQLGHGHVWAMAGQLSAPVVSEALHLTAASVWLGGLPPLLLLTARAPTQAAAAAAARFSPLGMACVAVMAATATLQAVVLVGNVAALTGTPYGRVALAKIVLFVVLLGMALLNRTRLVPALTADASARWRLCASLAAETAAGLLVVLAASLLSESQPGMSMPGM
jgi:putative copper export protein